MIPREVRNSLYQSAKTFLAMVLLSCFFMPLAQCSHKEPVEGCPVENAAPPSELIPFQLVEFQSASEIPFVAIFLLPLAFACICWIKRGKRIRLIVNIAELALAIFSIIWMKHIIETWGAIRYGGVIFSAAYSIYGLIALLIICIAVADSLKQANKLTCNSNHEPS